MSEMYRRRIRVESKPKDTHGYQVTVHDADTGEQLLHVAAIDMHLEASAVSTATVEYYEEDESGKLILDNGKPVRKIAETANPEVSVTAMETMPLIEQLQAEVQMYREANIRLIQQRRAEEEQPTSVIQAAKDYEDEEKAENERKYRIEGQKAEIKRHVLSAFSRLSNILTMPDALIESRDANRTTNQRIDGLADDLAEEVSTFLQK